MNLPGTVPYNLDLQFPTLLAFLIIIHKMKYQNVHPDTHTNSDCSQSIPYNLQ